MISTCGPLLGSDDPCVHSLKRMPCARTYAHMHNAHEKHMRERTFFPKMRDINSRIDVGGGIRIRPRTKAASLINKYTWLMVQSTPGSIAALTEMEWGCSVDRIL